MEILPSTQTNPFLSYRFQEKSTSEPVVLPQAITFFSTRLWGLCSFIAELSQCCTTARTRLLIPGDVIPPGLRFSLVAACVPVWGLSQRCSQGCSVPFDTELDFLMTKRKFFQYKACCICQQELKDGCKAQLDVADCILFLKAGSSLRSWPWTHLPMESCIA